MVWEDYFTSRTKLGPRKVGYFTIELISRVLDSKLLVLKSSNEKYHNNPKFLRSVPLLSFIALVYSSVKLVNP
jgi:hypothetical protein